MHVYTSPHLVRFNERYPPLQASSSSDEKLTAALEECERVNAGEPITLFEITTAVGMMLFSRHPADVVLMEVGLGGRFDATNVIERPRPRSSRRSSIDHAEFLGDTLEKIASEKAGILKRAAPAIVAAQTERRAGGDRAAAARLGAPLKVAGEDWTATEEHGRLVYQDDAGLLDLPPPRLSGRHQIENARAGDRGAARDRADQDCAAGVRDGIARSNGRRGCNGWRKGESSRWRRAGSEMWLDGGHNPDGGRAVAAALADLEERVSLPLVLIVGMLATKDTRGLPAQFYRARPPHGRRAGARCGQGPERGERWPMPRAPSACRRPAATILPRPSTPCASSTSIRRRASSSPARSISPARLARERERRGVIGPRASGSQTRGARLGSRCAQAMRAGRPAVQHCSANKRAARAAVA